MKLTVSDSDLKQSIILDPDWYLCEIKSVTEQPNKAGDALNTIVDMVVAEGEFAGVPLRQYFSERTPPAFVVPFLKALNEGELEPDEYDITDGIVGRRLKVQTSVDEYEGRRKNVPKDYASETEDL